MLGELFETALVALQPRISEIREFVMTTGTMLTPSSSSALSKVERLNFNLNRNEKSALKTLFEEIQEREFELSVVRQFPYENHGIFTLMA